MDRFVASPELRAGLISWRLGARFRDARAKELSQVGGRSCLSRAAGRGKVVMMEACDSLVPRVRAADARADGFALLLPLASIPCLGRGRVWREYWGARP